MDNVVDLVEVNNVPEGMAVLNITYNGQNGNLIDPLSYDLADADIKQIAAESVRSGSVLGIDAIDADFTDFVIDRFPATNEIPCNRLFIRSKTPFGYGS